MNDSRIENPFGGNTSSTPANASGDHQSSYIPLANSNINNENIIKKILEYIHDENKTQYGWFGSIFGTEKNASKNITFTILFLIITLFCVVIWWLDENNVNSHSFILNLIDKLLPLFTLAFGYLFGKQ